MREGLWQGSSPRNPWLEASIYSFILSGQRQPKEAWLSQSTGGWGLGSEQVGARPRELAPSITCVPADRTRPDLISEDLQRRFTQEVVQFQQAAVSRQLEDFRSKRLMGMTLWEQDLSQLEAWVGRDRASYEARERHVAERLLSHLEEMQ